MDDSRAWIPSRIPEVRRRRLTAHPDERGEFSELWRASWLPPGVPPFVQSNLSRSRAGVLRGMHFHRRQWDLWVVVSGSALAAVADVRPLLDGSAGRPSVETHALAAGDALLIPPHVAHGFHAPEEMALVYFVSAEYDGSDEHGFRWDDPDAAIDWPAGEHVVSDRDRANPSLHEAVARLRG
ncbi:MAG TPA: dTDP-4-dehydrorhamnose 3,5-epimerase family protein [Candidatus Limnocylindrales bacterium]|nr:dTDP-4-dehydrorhamnose 3,5-epimerase family protein [Candidatus Limnocylindrales bacterium]